MAVKDQGLGFEWVGTRLPPQVDGVDLSGLVSQLVYSALEVQQLIGDVLKQKVSFICLNIQVFHEK